MARLRRIARAIKALDNKRDKLEADEEYGLAEDCHYKAGELIGEYFGHSNYLLWIF